MMPGENPQSVQKKYLCSIIICERIEKRGGDHAHGHHSDRHYSDGHHSDGHHYSEAPTRIALSLDPIMLTLWLDRQQKLVGSQYY